MKSLQYIIYISSLLMVACSADDGNLLPEMDTDGQQTAILRLIGGVDYFDSPTRAATSDWENEATLYIQYETKNGIIKGVATYNEASDEWSVKYEGPITRNETMLCEVYYFENSKSSGSSTVKLDAYSSVFVDKNASYLYKDGIVHLTTHLVPQTGRIRFLGTPGYEFNVSGLRYYNEYNLIEDSLSTVEGVLSIAIGDNGYSPYIYVSFADEAKREMEINNQDDNGVYNTMFDSSVLARGKSGFLNVPTTEEHNGWFVTEKAPFCPDTNHPHIIDMGEAGKWACCNLGAKFPIDLGHYFAWGETKPKETYDWNSYTYCKGSSNTLTKYCTHDYYGTVDNITQLLPSDDAAHINWRESWRMPTEEELYKLSRCERERLTILGIKGFKITANNGNSLFLPLSVYWSSTLYFCDNIYNIPSCAEALFSTIVDFDDLSSYDWTVGELTTTSLWRSYMGDRYYYRCDGHSIRPVSE